MKIMEGKDSQQLDVRIRFDTVEEKQKAFRLLAAMQQRLVGYQREKEYLLRAEDVCFIASVEKRTFIYTAQGCFESLLWLYQVEDQLNDDFIRINKATIINMTHVMSMRSDIGSRIRVYLDNGDSHMVTRTYVKAFKQRLKGE